MLAKLINWCGHSLERKELKSKKIKLVGEGDKTTLKYIRCSICQEPVMIKLYDNSSKDLLNSLDGIVGEINKRKSSMSNEKYYFLMGEIWKLRINSDCYTEDIRLRYDENNEYDIEVPTIQSTVSIEEYKSEFADRDLKEQIRKINKKYCAIVEVKGGENTFYRAVMYRYLQYLVVKGASFLEEFSDQIQNQAAYLRLEKNKNKLCPILLGYIGQLIEVSKSSKEDPLPGLALLFKMVNYSPDFEEALIILLKKMVCNFIYANAFTEFEGKMQLSSYLSIKKSDDLDKYIKKKEKQGNFHDDMFIRLAAIVLRIQIGILRLAKPIEEESVFATQYCDSKKQIFHKKHLNFHNEVLYLLMVDLHYIV